jgi:hypothetical protein
VSFKAIQSRKLIHSAKTNAQKKWTVKTRPFGREAAYCSAPSEVFANNIHADLRIRRPRLLPCGPAGRMAAASLQVDDETLLSLKQIIALEIDFFTARGA